MRDTTWRRLGWTTGGAAALLVAAAAAAWPVGAFPVPPFQEEVVAGYLLVGACAAALASAVSFFAATPTARRRRKAGREVRVLLGHGCCAASVLLCVGVCVLWGASQRQWFGAVYFNGGDGRLRGRLPVGPRRVRHRATAGPPRACAGRG